jgi:hypothetical protein
VIGGVLDCWASARGALRATVRARVCLMGMRSPIGGLETQVRLGWLDWVGSTGLDSIGLDSTGFGRGEVGNGNG